jgi:hypothetical protein
VLNGRFLIKLDFANPWLFEKRILESLNAHTTTAPKIIQGGLKNNVIRPFHRQRLILEFCPEKPFLT